LKILSDDGTSDRLIKSGMKRAKLFSQGKSAAKHLQVFKIAASSYRKKRYFYYRFLYEPIPNTKMY